MRYTIETPTKIIELDRNTDIIKSKEDTLNYTKQMSNYIVVENMASGAPTTYTFPTLDDLRVWVTGKSSIPVDGDIERRVKTELLTKITEFLGGGSNKKVQSTQDIIDKYPNVSVEIFDIIKKNTANLSSPPTDLSYVEEFQQFRTHPEYVHYYISIILYYSMYVGTNINYNVELRNFLKEYINKNVLFEIKETQILYGNRSIKAYHDCVKELYSTFGEILPELAYGLIQWNLRDNMFDPLASDAKHTAKLWVQTYLNTFYVKYETYATKRSDFIEHFKAHSKSLVSKITNGFEISKLYLKDVLAHVEAPDKLLELPMVRRAPGMYIQGYSLMSTSVSNSIVEKQVTEYKEENVSALDLKRSITIETREVITNMDSGSIFTITTPGDVKNGFGYARFRIADEDTQHVPEITLTIGGGIIDRVYPSIRNAKYDNFLFPFTRQYQIPPLPYADTKLVVEKTKKPVKILYDVVKSYDKIDYSKEYRIRANITQKMRGYYGEHELSKFSVFSNLYVEGKVHNLSVRLPDTAYFVRYIPDDKDQDKYMEFKKIDDVWECDLGYEGVDLWDKDTKRSGILKYEDRCTEKYQLDIFADTIQYVTFMSGMAGTAYQYLK